MSTRCVRISGALLLASLVGLGRLPALAGEPAAQRPDLTGRWAYNKTLSDDARQKLHEAMARDRGFGPGGSGMSGGGYLGPVPGTGGEELHESMQALFEPAEELTVTQSEPEIVMEETYGRRRSLRPDGRKYKTENGTAQLKAEWKQGRLLVETKSGSGRKLVESWELSANRNRLIVEVRIEGGYGPALLLKRAYERSFPRP
jgi:hypothetical protein